MDFKCVNINGENIIVGGIGKMFYEDGFPIHISIDIAKDKGYKISPLHIADELYKNGWKERAIVNTLREDFPNDISTVEMFCRVGTDGEKQDTKPPIGQEWIYSKNGWEYQREIIFKYLWGYPSSEAMNDVNKRTQLSQIILH